MKRAMEKHDSQNALVVPIIIRDCDWTEGTVFSKLQAIPKDGVAINTWENRDSAWKDATQKLKSAITNFQPSSKISEAIEKELISATERTLTWLDDTEILLSHRKVNKVTLQDIYVSPDIRTENESGEIEYIDSKNILKRKGYHLISGEEQQGKTTLLKSIYLDSLQKEVIPLYIDASKISKSDLAYNIEKLIKLQLNNITLDKFINTDNKVILIDNIDKIKLNEKYRDKFISEVNNAFDYIIITCHDSFEYVACEISALDKYKNAKIVGLGNVKREEIVKKWISLGIEENINDEELYTQCDELKNQLDTVIKRNIVPGKPLYILMVLQNFEASAQLNIELTSYGHCYQQLIYQAFDKAKIKKTDFPKYLNVLTELSWNIFNHGNDLNSYEVNSFFAEYCEKFLTVEKNEVIEKLEKHSILAHKGNRLGFKYPYIYYFFVAKKIAEDYNSDDHSIKGCVSMLLENLHREDFANILIFITHHTKDSWVLSEIQGVLDNLFSESKKATLANNTLEFMTDFMNSIPKLVLEQREIVEERREHNKRLDAIERLDEEVNDDEQPEILWKINKTFKGMEIAGQIIRNRHAILTRDSLQSIADSGISSGLKFLDYFLTISNTAKNEIIKLISSHLAKNPDLSNIEIQEHAESTYTHLTYGVINAVIRKISSSIGSKEAYEIYDKLEQVEGSPAYTLIRQAIEFKFNRTLSFDSVEKTATILKNNPVCSRILKELVIHQTYMFPVNYRVKQQLSELLEISVSGQRLMDRKSRAKG